MEIPLFPNYIFVHVGRNGRVQVLGVPGVLSIVGGGKESTSVPESYIHCLQEGLRQRKIEPHPYLTAGAKVRIRCGVMAGMEGVLLRKKNNFRVVLTLQMIMKSIKVEVELNEIEPAYASHHVLLPEVAEVA